MEPIQTEKIRYSSLPIRYPKIAAMLENAQKLYWIKDEVIKKLHEDQAGYASMTPTMRNLLNHVLGFFAGADGIVNEIIGEELKPAITVREILDLYSQQEAIEVVHNQVYSELINAYVGEAEAEKLLNSMRTFPTVRRKIEFIRDSIRDATANSEGVEHSKLALQIFLAAIMEGLFFSGSFCVIFWIVHSGVRMPALAKANEFISRDEGLHTEASIAIYRDHIVHKLPESMAHSIMRQAMDVEREFIAAALPTGALGMNAHLMTEYLQFTADQLLISLGYSKIFNSEITFGFMEKKNVGVRITDFFVHMVSEYVPTGAVGELTFD